MNLKRTNLSPQASLDVAKLVCPRITEVSIIQYQALFRKLILKEGKKQAVAVLKGYYHIATRVAMHKPFIPASFRKSDKEGFPSDICYLKKHLLSSDPREKQAALTILRSYVSLSLTPSTDTSSITTDGVSTSRISWLQSWEKFASKWMKTFTFPCDSWRVRLRPTTKSGPNGPALMWSHIDALAIKECPSLWKSFVEYNSAMSQESLTKYTEEVYTFYYQQLVKTPIHSKLSYLSEGGGKTRVVAIGDFWTQEALKGIHSFLHNCLRKLTTDGTYDQGRIARITCDATKKGLPIYCYDLTAATDRFPVFMLEKMLSYRFGTKAASAWRALMSNRSFTTKSETVTYQVGTPMGFLSSWASFSLCHHLLIEYAAFTLGINSFRDYVLLGDDVAIFNKEVALTYKTLLNDLGVSISQDKSIISLGQSHSSAEIAKKLFYCGNEISPIPVDIIAKARRQPKLFPMLITTMIDRGVRVSPEEAGTLLRRWYSNQHAKFQPLLVVPPGLPGHISYPSKLVTIDPNASEGILIPYRNVGCRWSPYSVSTIRGELTTQRLASLGRKLDRMKDLFKNKLIGGGENTPPLVYKLAQIQQTKGIPIPDLVLNNPQEALRRVPDNWFAPVVKVIFREINELLQLEDDLSQNPLKELSLKEYVPDITFNKYFRTYEEVRQEYISSIMLDTLRILERSKTN